MNSLKNLEESMGCNTIRDDHGGGVIYQRVHMDKAEFDEMIRKVEEEYSDLQDENARLRSCLSDDAENARQIMGENAKLRELVYDMLQDEERGHNDELTFDEHVERANELGVRLDG